MINNKITSICFIPDSQWEHLKNMAMEEKWDYVESTADYPYPILRNYIYFTYQRIADLYNKNPQDNYLVMNKDIVCFNTGLLTDNYEEIFMIWKKNSRTNCQEWFSIGFFKESSFEVLQLDFIPKRAKYIESIEDLIFNTELNIVSNLEHILNEPKNIERLPENIKHDKNLASLFEGAVQIVKKRIRANYKLAVPQFYDGKMQFLLPLSLYGHTTKPDIVLAVDRINNTYRGYTCLTLDMAYNNARLISKPETDWLIR